MSDFGKLPVLLMTSAVLALSGCGNLESIHRTTGTESSGYKVAFVDAKQRGIVVTRASEGLRFCAEPSPDALASVAASFSGSLTGSSSATDKLSTALAGQLSGSAASIGLRTQSIQLMRDALYRLCEAHANGAITGFQMRSLQMRYQNMIIGLLAVEQLTGAVRAPAATTGSSTKTASGGQSIELSKRLAALDVSRDALLAELATKQKNEGDLKTKLDTEVASNKAVQADPVKTATEKAQSQAKEDKAKADHAAAAKITAEVGKKLKDTELMMSAVRADLAVTQAVGSSTSASASITEAATSPAAMNKETAQVISNAVSEIVVKVINQDNTVEACMEFLSEFVRQGGTSLSDTAADGVLQFCSIKLKSEEESLKKALSTFGGDKLGKLASYLADPVTRTKALAAFPAVKPPSVSIANGTYDQFRTNITQASNTGNVGTIQGVLNFHLKKPGSPTDLDNLDTALKAVEASIAS